MKKSIFGTALLLICSLSLSMNVFASPIQRLVLDLKTADVRIVGGDYDGAEITSKWDNDRLFISSSLNWLGSLPVVSGYGHDLINPCYMKIGNVEVQYGSETPKVLVDGNEVSMNDQEEAQLKQGWIPVRTVFQLAGYTVQYKEDHTVSIEKS